MEKYVRATAKASNKRSNMNVSFDLLLDADNLVSGHHLIFAYQYDRTDRNIGSIPFVIDGSGRTDFGEAYVKNQGRFGQTDIREKAIVVGCAVDLRGDNYNETYDISEIRTLLAAELPRTA